jgi:uncharacterized lipoprotein NlpE involved in copper resistance
LTINNLKKIFFAALVLFCFFGCNNKESEEILQAHIIEKHDDLMKKGDNIMLNKERLNKLLSKSEYADSASASLDTESFHKKVNDLNDNLTKADEAMMDWMNNFNPDFNGKSHEQIMAYLNKQQEAILKVEKQTDLSLEKSNSFLKQYSK